MTQHKTLTLTLIIGLLSLTSAAEDEGTAYSGSLKLGTGYSTVQSEGEAKDEIEDTDYGVILGDGSINLPIDGFSLQVDLGGLANLTSRNQGDDQFLADFHTALHLAVRDPASHAYGIFGYLGSSDGGEDENVRNAAVGVEGQKYFNENTLYAQTGFITSDDETDGDSLRDAWFVAIEGRHFLDDNQKLYAGISYVHGQDEDNDNDIDGLAWNLGYERRVCDKHPVVWFVDYTAASLDKDDSSLDNQATEHVFSTGLRFMFGVESLKENDRRGATFGLPQIARWTGWTSEGVD